VEFLVYHLTSLLKILALCICDACCDTGKHMANGAGNSVWDLRIRHVAVKVLVHRMSNLSKTWPITKLITCGFIYVM